MLFLVVLKSLISRMSEGDMKFCPQKSPNSTQVERKEVPKAQQRGAEHVSSHSGTVFSA